MNETVNNTNSCPSVSRRSLLRTAAASGLFATAAGSMVSTASAVKERTEEQRAPFRYALNTSTIRGQKLPIDQQVAITAKAGYDAIEPWIGDISRFVEQGGKLPDLKKQIDDAGLTVVSAIGFANWVVDDDAQRNAGLEIARRDMDLIAQLGGTHIAAPPAGATKQENLNLFAAADRYRALLKIGESIGVIPQLELWGFSQSLSRLGEVALVATEAAHPKACVLPDIYHIYKGGSEFQGLALFSSGAMHCFHVNDYPANPPRAEIADSARVYPGDGIAPMKQIFSILQANGFDGTLSLELFNREYWKQDPLAVARTGLQKTKQVVANSLSGR